MTSRKTAGRAPGRRTPVTLPGAHHWHGDRVWSGNECRGGLWISLADGEREVCPRKFISFDLERPSWGNSYYQSGSVLFTAPDDTVFDHIAVAVQPAGRVIEYLYNGRVRIGDLRGMPMFVTWHAPARWA